LGKLLQKKSKHFSIIKRTNYLLASFSFKKVFLNNNCPDN